MEIILTRKFFNDYCTIGELVIENLYNCFVLEDCDRGLMQNDLLEHLLNEKIKGKTCIPYGRYEIGLTYSNRFKKLLPILLNVPAFEGIRIHSGNTSEDTEGCLLPGLENNFKRNQVFFSKIAFGGLFPHIKAALEKEKVFITIKK